MKIAVAKETLKGERRVALTPDVAKKLVKEGFDVVIESDAGVAAGFPDEMYMDEGVKIEGSPGAALMDAGVVLRINKPTEDEIDLFPEGAIVIGFFQPLFDPQLMTKVAARKVTSFSMDAVPRTTRAQSMDALSSQANIAGYKAVLKAADRLPKLMPMLMTAAGTIQPAKALIVGAGVAGLQAIATARRLGAAVSAFDVRAATEEQVQSLGAKFVKIDTGESGEGTGGYARELSAEAQEIQRQKLGQVATGMDLVITTAAIPGRKAPVLIKADAVAKMRHGTVIVDMAAATGGNVEGSLPDEIVERDGVTIFGPTNLPAEMPLDASKMYAKNVTTLLGLMTKEGAIEIDWEDDILAAAVITRDGDVVHEKTKALLAG